MKEWAKERSRLLVGGLTGIAGFAIQVARLQPLEPATRRIG
jgi:hypothetical protein